MVDDDSVRLAGLRLSYAVPGATAPAERDWSTQVHGFHGYAKTVRIGQGESTWVAAKDAVLAWQVKTRSGFAVPLGPPDGRVRVGERYWIIARVGPVLIREPVEVVAVVDGPDRCGFAYGTLAGHPVAGEEAFIVQRAPDGAIWFTLRSLTRSPTGRWRWAFPLALLAQHWYRRRYLRALLPL
jgi:uncharacterized protein (UPF0548 family)